MYISGFACTLALTPVYAHKWLSILKGRRRYVNDANPTAAANNSTTRGLLATSFPVEERVFVAPSSTRPVAQVSLLASAQRLSEQWTSG